MDNELTDAEWNEMTERERAEYNRDRAEEAYNEMSRSEKARFEWENGS